MIQMTRKYPWTCTIR